MDLGIILEGVVELDPMSGRMVIRIQELNGSSAFMDIQSQMEKYKGEEVRFILTPLRTVSQLAKMVESGELPMDAVSGFRPAGGD